MKCVSVFFCVCIISIIFSACNSSSAQPTASPTPVIPSPTATVGHTPTPSIQAQLEFVLNTRLPSVPPLELPPDDLSIIASTFHRLQITRLMYTDRIVNEVAPANGVFLVVEAFVYNYSSTDHTYTQTDFVITNSGTSAPPSYLVDTDRTLSLQVADFPFHFAAPNFTVPARRVRQVVMVFVFPQRFDSMRFHYFGEAPRPFLEFFVLDTEDGVLQAIKYLAGRREGSERVEQRLFGAPVFTLDTQEVARLYDYQEWSFYNCDGAGEMRQTISYEAQSLELMRNQMHMNFNVTAGMPLKLLALVKADIDAHSESIFSQTLKEVRAVEIVVPPRTNSLYRMEVYFVNQTGIMEIKLGTQTLQLPYTLENRLRFHVRSVPAEPCP